MNINLFIGRKHFESISSTFNPSLVSRSNWTHTKKTGMSWKAGRKLTRTAGDMTPRSCRGTDELPADTMNLGWLLMMNGSMCPSGELLRQERLFWQYSDKTECSSHRIWQVLLYAPQRRTFYKKVSSLRRKTGQKIWIHSLFLFSISFHTYFHSYLLKVSASCLLGWHRKWI